jgi:hypothetical protein
LLLVKFPLHKYKYIERVTMGVMEAVHYYISMNLYAACFALRKRKQQQPLELEIETVEGGDAQKHT